VPPPLGVEVLARRGRSPSQVSELVDVQSVLAVGGESLEGAGDADWLVDGALAEGDQPARSRLLRIEDADGVALRVRLALSVEQEGGEGQREEAERSTHVIINTKCKY
jgi:hypothetical protein